MDAKSNSIFLAEKPSQSLCWTKSPLFGSSYRNQRQEAWSSFLTKSVMPWIIDFLKKTQECLIIFWWWTSNGLCEKQFWFLIQHESNKIKEVWNGNYICKSKYSNTKWHHDELYYLSYNNNQGIEVSDDDLTHMRSYVDDAFWRRNWWVRIIFELSV